MTLPPAWGEGGAGAGSPNNFVAVDAAATGGYLGIDGSTGVLRTGTGITYTDGGDFITLALRAITTDASATQSAIQIGSTNTVALSGAPNTTYQLTLNGTASLQALGAFRNQDSFINGATFANASATASAGMWARITTAGQSDAALVLQNTFTTTQNWCIGLDQSNSRCLAIEPNQSIGNNAPFKISTAGYVGIGMSSGVPSTARFRVDANAGAITNALAVTETSGQVSINTSSAGSARLFVVGDPAESGGAVRARIAANGEYSITTAENTDPGAGAGARYLCSTSGGGDAYARFAVSAGTTLWAAGCDNSNSDCYAITAGASGFLDDAAPFKISTGGLVGIGMTSGVPTTSRFRVDANAGAIANAIAVDETSGNFGIGIAASSSYRCLARIDATTPIGYRCDGSAAGTSLLTHDGANTNSGASSHAYTRIGAVNGNAYHRFYNSTDNVSFAVGQTSSTLVINGLSGGITAAPGLGATAGFRMTAAGLVGIGMSSGVPTTARFRVDANAGAITNALSVDETTGNVGILGAPGTPRLTIASATGTNIGLQIVVQASSSPNAAIFENTNAGTAAGVSHTIKVAATSTTGDPWTIYHVDTARFWSVGIDNSLSGDPLCFNPQASLVDASPIKMLNTGELMVSTQTPTTAAKLFVSNTSARAVMELDQDSTTSPFIEFDGTSGATTTDSISTHPTAGTIQGWVQVTINGTKRWIPFYSDPSA